MADTPTTSPIASYMDRYGPYGFGVLSLLLIWFTIVRPEMQASRLSFEEQRRIVSQMSEIVNLQKQVADSLKETAAALSRLKDGRDLHHEER